MLLVRTLVKPSAISGLGLFADQAIPSGSVIWEFKSGEDRELTEQQLQEMEALEQRQIRHHTYRCINSGLYILCGDDARYMNHSDTPNTRDETNGAFQGQTVASRDINPGEEITTNYFDYDTEADLKLGKNA